MCLNMWSALCVCVWGGVWGGCMPKSVWMSEDNYGIAGSLLSHVTPDSLAEVPLPAEPSHWPQGLI